MEDPDQVAAVNGNGGMKEHDISTERGPVLVGKDKQALKNDQSFGLQDGEVVTGDDQADRGRDGKIEGDLSEHKDQVLNEDNQSIENDINLTTQHTVSNNDHVSDISDDVCSGLEGLHITKDDSQLSTHEDKTEEDAGNQAKEDDNLVSLEDKSQDPESHSQEDSPEAPLGSCESSYVLESVTAPSKDEDEAKEQVKETTRLENKEELLKAIRMEREKGAEVNHNGRNSNQDVQVVVECHQVTEQLVNSGVGLVTVISSEVTDNETTELITEQTNGSDYEEKHETEDIENTEKLISSHSFESKEDTEMETKVITKDLNKATESYENHDEDKVKTNEGQENEGTNDSEGEGEESPALPLSPPPVQQVSPGEVRGRPSSAGLGRDRTSWLYAHMLNETPSSDDLGDAEEKQDTEKKVQEAEIHYDAEKQDTDNQEDVGKEQEEAEKQDTEEKQDAEKEEQETDKQEGSEEKQDTDKQEDSEEKQDTEKQEDIEKGQEIAEKQNVEKGKHETGKQEYIREKVEDTEKRKEIEKEEQETEKQSTEKQEEMEKEDADKTVVGRKEQHEKTEKQYTEMRQGYAGKLNDTEAVDVEKQDDTDKAVDREKEKQENTGRENDSYIEKQDEKDSNQRKEQEETSVRDVYKDADTEKQKEEKQDSNKQEKQEGLDEQDGAVTEQAEKQEDGDRKKGQEDVNEQELATGQMEEGPLTEATEHLEEVEKQSQTDDTDKQEEETKDTYKQETQLEDTDVQVSTASTEEQQKTESNSETEERGIGDGDKQESTPMLTGDEDLHTTSENPQSPVIADRDKHESQTDNQEQATDKQHAQTEKQKIPTVREEPMTDNKQGSDKQDTVTPVHVEEKEEPLTDIEQDQQTMHHEPSTDEQKPSATDNETDTAIAKQDKKTEENDKESDKQNAATEAEVPQTDNQNIETEDKLKQTAETEQGATGGKKKGDIATAEDAITYEPLSSKTKKSKKKCIVM